MVRVGSFQHSVFFLALDIYSSTGGLQNFNKRVVKVIEGMCSSGQLSNGIVLTKNDSVGDVPLHERISFNAYNRMPLRFVYDFLFAKAPMDLVLVGHINLLPMAVLRKFFNRRLKIVLFAHGVEVWNQPKFRKRRFYEPYLLKSVDVVCTVSSFTRRIMQEEFSLKGDRFHHLPNAVDYIDDAAPMDKQENSVLSVTRLAEHDRSKNIDAVIRAIALLKSQGFFVHYYVVGSGSIRDELEALAREIGVLDLVKFLGRVSDDELSRCYRVADAFVLPSSKEGFGIVFLEAWLRKLPVICGTDDAAQEFVEHGVNGFVVDHRDIAGLANHIRVLVEETVDAKRMGQNGYDKVMRMYLMESFRENLQDLIVTVCRPDETSRA